MKKLKSRLGETIAETLITVLIAALGMMLLAGAIVTAARINASLTNEDIAFKQAAASSLETVSVALDGGTPCSVPVNVYETQNHYTYYEYAN